MRRNRFWIIGSIVVLALFIYSGAAWNWFRPVVHKPLIDKYATIYHFDPLWVMAARRFEDGLRLYRARDFTGAIAIFEEILTKRDDGPSRVYIERCQQFIAEPPPSDWDGVWRMKEK